MFSKRRVKRLMIHLALSYAETQVLFFMTQIISHNLLHSLCHQDVTFFLTKSSVVTLQRARIIFNQSENSSFARNIFCWSPVGYLYVSIDTCNLLSNSSRNGGISLRAGCNSCDKKISEKKISTKEAYSAQKQNYG